MDTLKRLSDYLDSRRTTASNQEITLESIVIRGEKHLRRQRWLSAGAGALGMLVFVGVGSFAFNNGGPIAPSGDSEAATIDREPGAAAEFTATTIGPGFGFSEEAASQEFAFSRGAGSFPEIDLVDSPLADEPLSVSWTTSTSDLGWTEHIFESGGTFYALATAPGVTYEEYGCCEELPQAVYTSTDGSSWTAARLNDDINASHLAVSRSALYILSSAPGSAPSDERRIGRSADNGQTWAFTDIKLEASAPTEFGRVHYTNTVGNLAAGENGVVAVFNTSYEVDFWSVIPIEYHDRTKDRWPEPTTEGIVLRDWSERQELELECEAVLKAGSYSESDLPPVCEQAWNGEGEGKIVYSVTWAELGVDGPANGASEMFYSSDGVNFDRIESPFAPTSHLSVFKATASGFLAVESDRYDEYGGAGQVWTSTDGQTWTRLANVPQVGWVRDADSIPSGIVVVGEGYDDHGNFTVVSTTTDNGQTWTSIGSPRSDPSGEYHEQYASGISISDAGVAFGLSTFSYNEETYEESTTTELYITTDYRSWQRIDVGDLAAGGYADVIGLVVIEDIIRFDLQIWTENDGQSQTTYVGTIEG